MNVKHRLILTSTVLAALVLGACQGKESVVVVSGAGTVMAQPDTVRMNVSLAKTAPTTSEAQQEVNAMVRQTLAILQNAGVEEKNIKTMSLRFFPEYQWTGSRREPAGQKAEQVISFSMSSVDVNQVDNRVSGIIDQLIQINGIELQQMNFSVSDTAELYAQSRELAYQKAREKAEQYAKLSGQKVVKARAISEDVFTMSPISNRSRVASEFAAVQAADASSAALPGGELEITSQITVEFLIK